MLRIQSLLNPSESNNGRVTTAASTTPTKPTWSAYGTSMESTPQPETPVLASPIPKRNKLVKDAAVFTRRPVQGPVNFPPFEWTEKDACLNEEEQGELGRQHRRFRIRLGSKNEQGKIVDFPGHIPYSSDKKKFLNKTGLDAFDVFQYEFNMPNDPEPQKKYTVMWDYRVGLVRITPFFKACKYSKTTPAKALNANPGLKDLCPSITGGALVAQGYWMPYHCARAMCLTFCYNIRWPLTPVFGPSFLKECLRPEDDGFAAFKIDPALVQAAALEWKDRSPHPLATTTAVTNEQDIPRSAPDDTDISAHLRPRTERPQFKPGSPFDSESDADRSYIDDSSPGESPPLSPKSKPVTSNNAPYGSINRRSFARDTPLVSLSPIPREFQQQGGFSWRTAATTAAAASHQSSSRTMPKRRLTAPSPDDEYVETGSASSSSSPTSGVESSNSHKRGERSSRLTKKRKLSRPGREGYLSVLRARESLDKESSKKSGKIRAHKGASKAGGTSNKGEAQPTRSIKFTSEDFHAAYMLMNLHARDAKFARQNREKGITFT